MVEPVGRVNFVGRKAKRRKAAPAKKVALYTTPERVIPIERHSYSRKPGSGYIAYQRLIDAIIASSREDEYVTSSYMKVGV